MVSLPSSPPHPQTPIFIVILLFSSMAAAAMASVHEILPLYNLPKGLLPQEIKTCCIKNSDNSFTTELTSTPCYVRFSGGQLVSFDRIVKGKLGHGKVSQVSGIKAQNFLLWWSVTGMDVDEKDGMLVFHVGAISMKFPIKDFRKIRSCMNEKARSFSEEKLI